VPQRAVAIGVPTYRDPRQVTLGKVLALPFRKQREAWRDGDALSAVGCAASLPR
jgi:hypothetical protein